MTIVDLNAEILNNLAQLADDETAMKKVAAYIKKLLSKKEAQPMVVTPELEALIKKAEDDLASGKLKVLHNENELNEFYDSL